jgi:SAM-dependent methyltransferase
MTGRGGPRCVLPALRPGLHTLRMANTGVAGEPRRLDRASFDAVYDRAILAGGFVEKDEYYIYDRNRYFQSLRFFVELSLPRSARILEIGGGQLAILSHLLFDDYGTVGDISPDFRGPVEAAGLDFVICDLLGELGPIDEPYDAIVMLEVVGQLPVPPHSVFEKVRPWLKPGGILFLTTPNLFRLRNVVRMAVGREFTDHFQIPRPGTTLGRQYEYSADHMRWQLEHAGFEIVLLKHDQLGQIGHSARARLARRLTTPLRVSPRLREELVIAARKPAP